ncbi:unnamed protein product [Vitrella brassicaformis CCMP3155]|uniref:Uncharacterized protein n=1 Tax=Vitrella brassicaformis (strain CCMP3155) TaxID=1169540 RepID=A0A0G4EPS4_VITBC|nr:unnamed protein product [Vitrella brassicaformis CCMP3155]|mmetsp:Transcript_24016/g.69208  ORF Transcript_24016/g.69208 Transcript_24016/m.69208 type:complete len:263 (+) Transcript_24016:176-964(+)|eukprot:CEL99441.1 unnamed protein product [Vitrella brassicaformis CCMP3155]
MAAQQYGTVPVQGDVESQKLDSREWEEQPRHDRGNSVVTPLIFLWQFIWLAFTIGWYSAAQEYSLWTWFAVRLVFGVVVGALGYQGFFLRTTRQLTMAVGILPLVATIIAAAVPGDFRTATADLLDATPLWWLFTLQYVRVLAVGTLIKYFRGKLPLWWAAMPATVDFLHAVPVLVTGICLTAGVAVNTSFLIFLCAVGISVAPLAVIFLYYYLPSLWGFGYTGGRKPDTREVLSYPMVLMPTYAVPSMVEFQLFTLIKLVT